MRRSVVVVALVAALVVALVPLTAATSQARPWYIVACNTDPCFGSDSGENIWEQRGRGVHDEIRAKAGDDWVQGQTYTDDRDLLIGGKGDDEIWAKDGDPSDQVYGSLGHDTCHVDSQEEHIEGCEDIDSETGEVVDMSKYLRIVVWCNTIPCYGGDGYNEIWEQTGRVDDVIFSKGGADKVYTASWDRDRDVVHAGRGADTIVVVDNDAHDRIDAGPGADICFVDEPIEATEYGEENDPSSCERIWWD
jgi:Ca2+-binding RTX toxin-like protein